jgi:hypothetical protein
MKPRDRMLVALSLTDPDDFVPVWEIEFHLFNAFSREKLVISQDYIRLTEAGRDRALRRNAEIMVDVAKRIGLCALSNIGPYWEVAPGEPAPMWYPPEDSERFLPILRKAAGDDIFIMEWCQAMLLMPEADDYLEFAYKLFDTPQEVDQMARVKYKRGIEIARRARDAGADGLCAACDIADTKGMYFSPEQMDRFFLPYLRDWGREVAAMGMKSILHTDGNIMDALDNIADSGINGLQAIDPVAHMDIVEVKRRVGGKIALCGNIDLGLLQNGPIPAIEEEVKRICDGCKTGGGFVLGATNAVFTEIPAEHYLAMTAAGRQFGRYVR